MPNDMPPRPDAPVSRREFEALAAKVEALRAGSVQLVLAVDKLTKSRGRKWPAKVSRKRSKP